MENLVPLGTGNSRLMKSNIPASTTLAQLIQMLNNGTFPYDIGPLNSAGISQQGTPLNKATLFSDQTMAKYPTGIEDPDGALDKLANSVLYFSTQTPMYTEVTVDLSSAQPGDIVRLPENGKLVEFYVGTLNYEQALNGAGRVLLVRKDCYKSDSWTKTGINAYQGSNLRIWLINDYKPMLGADVQQAIGTTEYYYTPGGGNTNIYQDGDPVFILSLAELGETYSYANVEGSALPISETLKIAHRNGSPVAQWTRTPTITGRTQAVLLSVTGTVNYAEVNSEFGWRPCFTLPNTFTATYYVDDDGNLHDEQEYEVVGSITDIFGNPVIDLPVTQIYTGSYTGTGTYGSSNQNTLTFPFEPKLVFVILTSAYPVQTSFHLEIAGQFLIPWGISRISASADTNGSGSYVPYLNFTYSGTSLSWYASMSSGSANATHQFNTSGASYSYVAIG